jgi:hypothetical protein
MSNRRCLLQILAAVLAVGTVVAAGRSQAAQPLPDKDRFLAETRKRLRSDNLVQGRYIHTERETKRERDGDGTLTSTNVRLIEVYPSPAPRLTHRRVISVNGVTTSNLAERDARFRERAKAWIAEQERKGLTPAEAARQRRQLEDVKERAIIDELMVVYDFSLIGRETIDGRPAIVINVKAKPTAPHKSREAGIIKHFGGKVWIDEQDYELVRAQMESVDAVTYGWGVVAKLSKGATAKFERRKLNGDAWLPIFAQFQATGRVMLVKRIQMDETYEYFDYRKAPGEGIVTFPLVGP